MGSVRSVRKHGWTDTYFLFVTLDQAQIHGFCGADGRADTEKTDTEEEKTCTPFMPYIGVTTNVYKRFYAHIHGDDSSFGKSAWISELRSVNKMVIMKTLEEVEDRERAREQEAYWIKHFELLQEPLLNIHKMSSPRKARKVNLRSGQHSMIKQVKIVAKKQQNHRQRRSQRKSKPERSQRLDPQDLLAVYQPGMSQRQLASLLGVDHTTVGRHLKRLRSQNEIEE